MQCCPLGLACACIGMGLRRNTRAGAPRNPAERCSVWRCGCCGYAQPKPGKSSQATRHSQVLSMHPTPVALAVLPVCSWTAGSCARTSRAACTCSELPGKLGGQAAPALVVISTPAQCKRQRTCTMLSFCLLRSVQAAELAHALPLAPGSRHPPVNPKRLMHSKAPSPPSCITGARGSPRTSSRGWRCATRLQRWRRARGTTPTCT